MESDDGRTPFIVLLHAHDHIWKAKDWPLAVRAKACAHILVLMSELLTIKSQ